MKKWHVTLFMLILPNNEEASEEVAVGIGTTGCRGAILCDLGADCLQDEPSGSNAWRAESSERTRSVGVAAAAFATAATATRKIGAAAVERIMLPGRRDGQSNKIR